MSDDHLLPLRDRPAWHTLAACHGRTDLFFDPARQDQALELCDRCPVTEPCAEAGRNEAGVWGGRPEAGFRTGVKVTCRCSECGDTFTRVTAPGARPLTCGYRCRQDRNLRLARDAKARRAS